MTAFTLQLLSESVEHGFFCCNVNNFFVCLLVCGWVVVDEQMSLQSADTLLVTINIYTLLFGRCVSLTVVMPCSCVCMLSQWGTTDFEIMGPSCAWGHRTDCWFSSVFLFSQILTLPCFLPFCQLVSFSRPINPYALQKPSSSGWDYQCGAQRCWVLSVDLLPPLYLSVAQPELWGWLCWWICLCAYVRV